MNVCPNGHRNPRGHIYCGTCGTMIHPEGPHALNGDAESTASAAADEVGSAEMVAEDVTGSTSTSPGTSTGSTGSTSGTATGTPATLAQLAAGPATPPQDLGRRGPVFEEDGVAPATPRRPDAARSTVLFDDDYDAATLAAHPVKGDPSTPTPRPAPARPAWWKRRYLGFTPGLWVLLLSLLVYGLMTRA